MKKISIDELEQYDPPGHFDMTAMRIVGEEKDGAESMWMGLSHFLPGGGAETSASDTEKIYHLLEGEILVETPEGEETLLEGGDTLFIPPGEERSIVNPANEPASMLVVGATE